MTEGAVGTGPRRVLLIGGDVAEGRALRDRGVEVIWLPDGSAEALKRAAIQEGVDAIVDRRDPPDPSLAGGTPAGDEEETPWTSG